MVCSLTAPIGGGDLINAGGVLAERVFVFQDVVVARERPVDDGHACRVRHVHLQVQAQLVHFVARQEQAVPVEGDGRRKVHFHFKAVIDSAFLILKTQLIEPKFLGGERRVELRGVGERIPIWSFDRPRSKGLLHFAKGRAQVQNLTRDQVFKIRAIVLVFPVAIVDAIEQVHGEVGVQSRVSSAEEGDLHGVSEHKGQLWVGVLVVRFEVVVALQDGNVLCAVLVGDNHLQEGLAPAQGGRRNHLDLHVAFRWRRVASGKFHRVKPELQRPIADGLHFEIRNAHRGGSHQKGALALTTPFVCDGQLERSRSHCNLVCALTGQDGSTAAIPVSDPFVLYEHLTLIWKD